jgi:hypothetical protein
MTRSQEQELHPQITQFQEQELHPQITQITQIKKAGKAGGGDGTVESIDGTAKTMITADAGAKTKSASADYADCAD